MTISVPRKQLRRSKKGATYYKSRSLFFLQTLKRSSTRRKSRPSRRLRAFPPKYKAKTGIIQVNDGVIVKLGNNPEGFEVNNSSNDSSSNVDTRPKFPDLVPIWAVSRQEVCESFDWFRSYQGGVYSSKEVVKGYLLGGFSSKRDGFFDGGRLIISHGYDLTIGYVFLPINMLSSPRGGKSEAILTWKGQSKLQKPGDQQAEDKSVRALVNNYRRGIPVVLLIDHKYSLFPFSLRASGMSYVVLGLYYISHFWAEKEVVGGKNVVRFKFAFQWADKARICLNTE
ncbi:hypothetical protein V5O48_004956 [Marasmius crinis-equi]|uniref:Uncharacterized protein n=1 Tax=Marasmius crinis-equi TaxID=585013 RepID=A0ABR3FPL0_9AGAR